MRRELPVLNVGFSHFGVLSRARSDESDVRWERGTQPPGVAFALFGQSNNYLGDCHSCQIVPLFQSELA
jgi:hypothetical protein